MVAFGRKGLRINLDSIQILQIKVRIGLGKGVSEEERTEKTKQAKKI